MPINLVNWPPCEGPTYSQSKLETAWFGSSAVDRICKTTRQQFHGNITGAWLSYVSQTAGSGGSREPSGAGENRAISSLSCSDGRLSFLEPLTGMARHPCATVIDGRQPCPGLPPGCSTPLRDPSHLVLLNRCGQPPFARSVFLDAGAGGPADPEAYRRCRAAASKKGDVHLCNNLKQDNRPSIGQFARLYEERCIVFDRIYGWERAAKDPSTWWPSLERRWQQRTSFYNVAVKNEDAPPAPLRTKYDGRRQTIDKDAEMSVLSWLRETVKPEDFVVLKVDVDHSPTELSIVHAIARDPRLRALVDELFFEYHFVFDLGVEFGWGDSHYNRSVDDALTLMRDLRAGGVRAHFWT